MKKTTIRLIILCLVLLFPISTYFLIDHLYNNSMINSLEKYKIKDNEKIINEFTYDNNNYLITMYYVDKQTYSNVNILLKQKSDRLLIDTIYECDSSESNTYVLDNKIYIHCIGKMGDIKVYTLENYKLTHNILELDYSKTPNLSQLHILIDKVDKDNIYLYSYVNADSEISNKVKCSLHTKKCEYIEEKE